MSAGRHTRATATVYPVCGDLIVVLNRNSVCVFDPGHRHRQVFPF